MKIPIALLPAQTLDGCRFGRPLAFFAFPSLPLLRSFSAHRNCAVNLRWQFGSGYRKQSWLEFVLTLALFSAIPCYVIPQFGISFLFFRDLFFISPPNDFQPSHFFFYSTFGFYTLLFFLLLNRLAAYFAWMWYRVSYWINEFEWHKSFQTQVQVKVYSL